MRSLAVCGCAALLAAVACKSSAPYTLPAAAVNSAVAAGAAAHQRASGGCFATCTNGTVCNPRTGYCERMPEACVGSYPGCAPSGPTLSTERSGNQAGALLPGVGVSPETGRAPPGPGERPSAERP